MTEYAAPITIPRQRPIMSAVHRIAPWFAAIALGFVFGLAQGALQSDNHWAKKIVERSQVDPSGIALPVYEDQGHVYKVRRESRP